MSELAWAVNYEPALGFLMLFSTLKMNSDTKKKVSKWQESELSSSEGKQAVQTKS